MDPPRASGLQVPSSQGERGAAAETAAAAADAAARRCLRIDQALAVAVALAQAFDVAAARQREALDSEALCVLALLTLAALVPACAPRYYSRHRPWLLPLLRVPAYIFPSASRAGAGAALLLERPPRPGWRGAAVDVLRVAAATRAGLIALQGCCGALPPLVAAGAHAVVVAATWPGRRSGYCRAPLLTDPLTAGRLARLASALDALNLPMLSVHSIAEPLPPPRGAHQSAAGGGGGGAGAISSDESLCLSILGFAHLGLGLLLPVLVAALHCRPRPDATRGGAGAGAGAAGGGPKRWRPLRAAALRARQWDRAASDLCASWGDHSLARAAMVWVLTGWMWEVSTALAG
ncbi:hypothetical protein Rsub_06951 [Raphidocelis subcapitata]|uniref:Uncharacterized protein n=1 Tax=Raphidocelis subcapitata TaxID=307507 RepID=A0A2V0P420_9CHLO|nr:hypothetical protein Rsub_06951 [Raphidocelis subcapitata]|eukprot:GBF94329.1 hypothetical protein Rsub_06951 [Raphidocelis subcapitata]